MTKSLFRVSSGITTQHLDIGISDKPASITGIVRDHDNPASRPFVDLVRSPFTVTEVPYQLETQTGDAKDTFRFTGLAPGEYRLLAIPPGDRYRLEEPAILDGLLRNAKTVTLEQRGYQNISLDLQTP